MSLLPGQIIPQQVPIGRVNPDGTVIIEKNWWLLLYNLCANTIGTGGSSASVPSGGGGSGGGSGGSVAGLPASALTELAAADSDIADTDAIALQGMVSALLNTLPTDPGIPSTVYTDPLLLQDLPDPTPQAQPAASVSPTGSPFTYTAPFRGVLSVTSGTVSNIEIIRTSTTVETGLTAGLIPLSRLDQAKITYTGPPTLVFLPT